MGKPARIAVWTACWVMLAALLTADKAKPVPGPIKPYLGMDIAVVQVGTTGDPEWSPTFTLKNLGTRRIRRSLEMLVKANGGPIATGPLWVDLYPGKTLQWKGGPESCNFARVGDVIEATIDAGNKLAEDNEDNNTLSRTIALRISSGAVKKR